ncbi:DnaA ATPase domain-containing protein [Parasutterella sp.]|uniref:DnaA ATPase domain-containing protein n=1 Tax=Parasutterella sp. TaxID=2049037 RepID=UPI003994CCBB
MQVNDLVESEKDKKEQIRGQLPLDFFPEKQPTLSNFIVGSNSEAVAVISELKEGRGPQFTYLWGYEGVGKTHLVRALGKQSEGVPAFDENRTIYAVDNVQDLTPEQQQELFVLYNTVREHPGTHLVVTADRSPKDFERQGFRKDLTSRFSWGVVFELSPLSDEQKRRVILGRRLRPDLKVAPVLNWIENNFPHCTIVICFTADRYAMSAKSRDHPLIKNGSNAIKIQRKIGEIRVF